MPLTTVAIYARSSKDAHDVSCKAQVEEITNVIREKGEVIHRIYEDKALSSTKDDLPALQALLQDAGLDPPPFSRIYVYDTSRLARDTFVARSIKHFLRKKRGIESVFLYLPQMGNVTDEIIERIMEAFDELHSKLSKLKGVAGQKQNIRLGYRAGGPAPYGYHRKEIVIRHHPRDEHPIVKTVLEPDPETAPIIKEYFERRAVGEGRDSIFQDFWRRGIPSPSGKERWYKAVGYLLEKMVETYAGHLLFNRSTEELREGGYLGGKRFKPRSEWVIHRSAHPPIISEEIAARILAMAEEGRRRYRVSEHRHLLTAILTCAKCGRGYAAYMRERYSCLSRQYWGKDGCSSPTISAKRLERFVLQKVKEEWTQPERLALILEEAERRRREAQEKSQCRIPWLEAELKKVKVQLDRLFQLYSEERIDADRFTELHTPLWERKKALEAELAEASQPPMSLCLNVERLKQVIAHLDQDLTGNRIEQKKLLRIIFKEIRVHPRRPDGSIPLDFISDLREWETALLPPSPHDARYKTTKVATKKAPCSELLI